MRSNCKGYLIMKTIKAGCWRKLIESKFCRQTVCFILALLFPLTLEQARAETSCKSPYYVSDSSSGVQYCVDARGLAYEYSTMLRTSSQALEHCSQLKELTKNEWFLPSISDIARLPDTEFMRDPSGKSETAWFSSNVRINGRLGTPTAFQNNFSKEFIAGSYPGTYKVDSRTGRNYPPVTASELGIMRLSPCMAILPPPSVRFQEFKDSQTDVQVKGILKKTEFGTWSIVSYLPGSENNGDLKIFKSDGTDLVDQFRTGATTLIQYPEVIIGFQPGEPRSSPHYDETGHYIGPKYRFDSVDAYLELSDPKNNIGGLIEDDFILAFGKYSPYSKVLELTKAIKLPFKNALPFQICQAETKNFRSTEFGCMLFEDTEYKKGRIYFPWDSKELSVPTKLADSLLTKIRDEQFYGSHRTIDDGIVTNPSGELTDIEPDVAGNRQNRTFLATTTHNGYNRPSAFCNLIPKDILHRVTFVTCAIGGLVPMYYNLARPEVAAVLSKNGESKYTTSFYPLDRLRYLNQYVKYFSVSFPNNFKFAVSDKDVFTKIQTYKKQMWTALRGQAYREHFDAFEDPLKPTTSVSIGQDRWNIPSSNQLDVNMKTLTVVDPRSGTLLTLPRYDCFYKKYVPKDYPGEPKDPGMTVECGTDIIRDTIKLTYPTDFLVTTFMSNEIEARPFYNPEGIPIITCQKFRTNPVNNLDVDGSGNVNPLDVLILVNWLNDRSNPDCDIKNYLDANGDGFVNPLDVLSVINELNKR